MFSYAIVMVIGVRSDLKQTRMEGSLIWSNVDVVVAGTELTWTYAFIYHIHLPYCTQTDLYLGHNNYVKWVYLT